MVLTEYNNEWKKILGKKISKKVNSTKAKKTFKIWQRCHKLSKDKPYDINKWFKYFIGYNDDVIRPLGIMLPQMIGCVKCFESNKTMSFKISDNKLLKKYIQIWKKVENLLNIKFDGELFYGDNDKYIKTQIRLYDNNANTSFHNKNVPKENVLCKSQSLIKQRRSIIPKHFYKSVNMEKDQNGELY